MTTSLLALTASLLAPLVSATPSSEVSHQVERLPRPDLQCSVRAFADRARTEPLDDGQTVRAGPDRTRVWLTISYENVGATPALAFHRDASLMRGVESIAGSSGMVGLMPGEGSFRVHEVRLAAGHDIAATVVLDGDAEIEESAEDNNACRLTLRVEGEPPAGEDREPPEALRAPAAAADRPLHLALRAAPSEPLR